MTTLTSKQRKYLKSCAHGLKPVIQIGKAGLTKEVLESIAKGLASHELMKIKFIAFKEEKQDFIEPILEHTGAAHVSTIGHILTLYREAEEAEARKFKLPK